MQDSKPVKIKFGSHTLFTNTRFYNSNGGLRLDLHGGDYGSSYHSNLTLNAARELHAVLGEAIKHEDARPVDVKMVKRDGKVYYGNFTDDDVRDGSKGLEFKAETILRESDGTLLKSRHTGLDRSKNI